MSLEQYKAELLYHIQRGGVRVHLLINGGCGFRTKFLSASDDILEEIHFKPSATSKIIARWVPSYRNGKPTTSATMAMYEEEGRGYVRFDNAHEREKLHLDIDFDGVKGKHIVVADISRSDRVDPRRIALVTLLSFLENRGEWQLPVQFYMPFCTWWPEYKSLPLWLRGRKPTNVSMSTMCEAMMLQAAISPDTTRAFQKGAVRSKDPAVIMMSIADQVGKELAERRSLNWRVKGLLALLPFPIMAPPGSSITGYPPIMIRLLKERADQVRGGGFAPLTDY